MSACVKAQCLLEGDVLGMDGGYGCAEMWMFSMLLNRTLKMVKMANAMYILP